MTNSTTINPLLKPLARKVNLAVWLNASFAPIGILLVVFATLLLLLKMLAIPHGSYAFFLLALLPIAPLIGHLRSKHSRAYFTPYQIAEVLDHLFRNDGAVTASYERPELIPPDQLQSMLAREMNLRIPRFDFAFYARKSAPVCVYILLALLIPARKPIADPAAQEILTTIAQPLQEKLEINQEIIPEAERQALEKELKELTENKQGISKEKWEAVEELEKRIDNAARESHNNLDNLLANLDELSENANKSSEAQTGADEKARMEALTKNIGMTLQNGKVPLSAQNKKDLSKLLEQMKNGKGKQGDIKKQLSDLQKQLSKLTKKSEGRCASCGKQECNGQCKGKGDQPGRGGISRGRADAAMSYGEERNLEGAKFEKQEVENQFLSPDDITDLGITAMEPNTDPGKFSPGTIQSFQPKEGDAVSRSRISPAQKDVVEGYFSK